MPKDRWPSMDLLSAKIQINIKTENEDSTIANKAKYGHITEISKYHN